MRTNCFLNFQTSSPVQKVKKKRKSFSCSIEQRIREKTTENKGCVHKQYAKKKKLSEKTYYHQKKGKKDDLIFYASFLKFWSETEF